MEPSLAASAIESTGEMDVDTVHVDAGMATPKESGKEKDVSASTELAEEGIKVEAANLAEDDGVKVEKPKAGGGTENQLGKDW